MAKVIVDELNDGGTLIYQKNPKVNGYSIVLGFNGGAKLDGDIHGLSHLVEHLIFKEKDNKKTSSLLNKLLKYNVTQNAMTTQDYILVDYFATKENAEKSTSILVDQILKPRASKEVIDNEIKVIGFEKSMSPDQPETIDERFLETISLNFPERYKTSRLIGNMKELKKKVTPEVVKDYVEKYFNKDNLIVCALSNDPYEKVKEFCEKNIFSKIPNATDEKYIIPLPEPIIYDTKNYSFIVPNTESSTVDIDFMLRERLFESENIELEKAFDEIEFNVMADLGGILFDRFRTQKQLAYTFTMLNDDLQTAKFKKFLITTSGAKVNSVIKEFCLIAKELAEKGIDKKLFEDRKASYIDAKEKKCIDYKPFTATGLFTTYFEGYDFVDYDKVYKYIKNMTYEEFNEHIKSVYKKANASLIVSGDFDSRKVYNLIEIEELMGKKVNSDQKPNLNLPRVEATPMTLDDEEASMWEEAAPQIELLMQLKEGKITDFSDLKNLAAEEFEDEIEEEDK